ncbi:MAG: hypothetical protein FJX59_10935 [Alphaproteobacteria bacterium]|nr:hypothetical protein [Alphaproteobacteria bacterium]
MIALIQLWVSLAIAAPTPPSPEIGIATTPTAWVLTDAQGHTVYVYDRDSTPGQSACGPTCVVTWPPVLASNAASASGPWSQIVRAEGELQWAYKGKPLYRSAKETLPGMRYGERPENPAWRVAEEPIPMPSEISLIKRHGATLLADLDGRVLYTRDDDKIEQSRLSSGCKDACLTEWRPLDAPWLAQSRDSWSVVPRGDDLLQWAYQGKALYARAHQPKDADIDLDPKQGPWRPVVIVPTPPVPSWVTRQATDGGLVYADAKGLTLYAYEAEQNVNRPTGGASERGCNAFCMNEFRPVAAAADARPIGEWLPVTSSTGARQWAYKGMLVFTHAKDRRPGDIVGTKAFRVWHTILPSGEAMQGTGGG